MGISVNFQFLIIFSQLKLSCVPCQLYPAKGVCPRVLSTMLKPGDC